MAWWREIPIVKQFLELLIRDTAFQTVALSYLVAGVIFLTVIKGHLFPYGKLYLALDPKFTKRLKMVPTRLGVFLSHFPNLVAFAYTSLYYPNSNINSCACYTYIIMLSYRCFIYPWFRKKTSTKIPARTVSLVGITGFLQGLIAARAYAFAPSQISQIQELILTGLFVIIGIAIIYCDFTICRSRGMNKPKECHSKDPARIEAHKKEVEEAQKDPTYKVIIRPLFKKVCCPQYGFQFFQWVVWINFIGDPLALSIIAWAYYLLIVRADDQKAVLFGIYRCSPFAKFVYDLKPALPFLTDGRFFMRFLLRQY